MTEPISDRPARRPRYRGRNPRHFHEKYKELQPERYADDIAKVIASGKTPAGMHRPILVNEILKALAPKPGEIAVDCTLGYGGHAKELLSAIAPGGRLLGLDSDPIELPKTEARLRALDVPATTLVLHRGNFAGLSAFLATEAPEGVDVMLADLGLSSMQIDDPARGFTYKVDGPLDMRMNPSKGLTASAMLSRMDVASLARILSENADEPHAHELAVAIRRAPPITTTHALTAIVRDACAHLERPSRVSVDDTIRRVFQALRIAVNDEFGALDALLRSLPSCLKPGGRAAILTFHSGEDRRVKTAFKDGLNDGTYAAISDDVIRASPEERFANPRSSSAKLRFAVRA